MFTNWLLLLTTASHSQLMISLPHCKREIFLRWNQQMSFSRIPPSNFWMSRRQGKLSSIHLSSSLRKATKSVAGPCIVVVYTILFSFYIILFSFYHPAASCLSCPCPCIAWPWCKVIFSFFSWHSIVKSSF